MLTIGLTGGIGSGKSTVSAMFEKLGVPVVDADVIAHHLVEPNKKALASIVNAFGDDIIDNNGRLLRSKLRDIIHVDPTKKTLLESILHPLIKKEIQKKIKSLNTDYCIVVVPLLLESGWQKLVDRILVVDTPPEQQIKRIQTRDLLSKKQSEAILQNQMSRQNRLAAADDIIDNSDQASDLQAQVEQLHQRYKKFSRRQQN